MSQQNQLYPSGQPGAGVPAGGAYPAQSGQAYPGQVGQGYSGQSVSAPVRKSPLRWILIAVGAVVVLVVLALVLALGVLKKGDADSNSFIGDVTSGNTAAAYQMFAPELQQQQTQATFEAGVSTLKLSASCTMKWTSLSAGTSSAGSTKQADGTLTCPGATAPYAVSLTWVKQGSAYKVFAYSIMP